MKNGAMSLDTSVEGFFHVTRHLVKTMLVKRYGRIVNIVSLSGVKGMQGQRRTIPLQKPAVIRATKRAFSHTKYGKRKSPVNAVAPGLIQTDMTGDLDQDLYKKMIPMERFGPSGRGSFGRRLFGF
jgi:3-oxoacyl-[acyl-carrier protein] reductase